MKLLSYVMSIFCICVCNCKPTNVVLFSCHEDRLCVISGALYENNSLFKARTSYSKVGRIEIERFDLSCVLDLSNLPNVNTVILPSDVNIYSSNICVKIINSWSEIHVSTGTDLSNNRVCSPSTVGHRNATLPTTITTPANTPTTVSISSTETRITTKKTSSTETGITTKKTSSTETGITTKKTSSTETGITTKKTSSTETSATTKKTAISHIKTMEIKTTETPTETIFLSTTIGTSAAAFLCIATLGCLLLAHKLKIIQIKRIRIGNRLNNSHLSAQAMMDSFNVSLELANEEHVHPQVLPLQNNPQVVLPAQVNPQVIPVQDNPQEQQQLEQEAHPQVLPLQNNPRVVSSAQVNPQVIPVQDNPQEQQQLEQEAYNSPISSRTRSQTYSTL